MNSNDRNRLLLTLGIIGTFCVLILSCALVTGGAYLVQNRNAAADPSTTNGNGQGSTRDSTDDNSGENNQGGGREPGVTTPDSSATKSENVLNVPGADPPTLDPHLTSDAFSAEYIVEIFSGLVTLDRDMKLQPDLAESWEVSEDGRVYTFTLRDDAKFADGKAVTADDFKYSFERACDSETESPVADTYLGDIVGCREKLSGSANEVSGVQVVDPQTLEITIDEAKVFFLSKLTYPTAYVVDREAVENGGREWSTTTPNGSGPFMLDSYVFAEEIVLVPNPNYYGSPKPSLERVVFSLSGGSLMTRYETGELDITPVGLADIDRVLDEQNPLNRELVTIDSLSIGYIGLNAAQPPFDDPKVRQAFAMAVDKEALSNVVLRGMASPAAGILPPTLPGYNADVDGLEFNAEQAKALIEESKYAGNLPDITLHLSGGGGATPTTIEALVEMWRQNLGVEVIIEQTEFATFLSDINRSPNPYQMFSLGWVADYPDPQNFLDILFHCESLDNHTGYCNPEVDLLLEEARVETEESRRLELYHQVEQTIVNDAAWIPLWFNKEYWLVKPYLRDMVIPSAVIPRLKYISVNR